MKGMSKIGKHPTLIFVGILILSTLVSAFTDTSTEAFAFVALLVGSASYANSLFLNQRINKIEDVLYEKNVAVLGDFSVHNKDVDVKI